jgi:CBS domain-containing protein
MAKPNSSQHYCFSCAQKARTGCFLTARIVLHRRPILAYFKILPVFAAKFSDDMDVSGTIGAILNHKSGEVFSISPDAMVLEAIEMMDNKNVGALLVMEQDRLAGIISERDYTRKVILRGKRSRETKVAEIMSTNLTVTHPREPVEKCLRLMTDKHIRHLPVLDGDKVVGVISIGDLVKWVISCQSAAIAHLESYIHGGYTG